MVRLMPRGRHVRRRIVRRALAGACCSGEASTSAKFRILNRVRTTVPSSGLTCRVPSIGTSWPARVITSVGRFVSRNSISHVSIPSIFFELLRVNVKRACSEGRKKNIAAVGTLKLRLIGPMLNRALSFAMRVSSLESPAVLVTSETSRSLRSWTGLPSNSMTSRNPVHPPPATRTMANSALSSRGRPISAPSTSTVCEYSRSPRRRRPFRRMTRRIFQRVPSPDRVSAPVPRAIRQARASVPSCEFASTEIYGI